MANPFGDPVAQNVNVNPNQAIQTLSGLVGLKQQQQALQTGQYDQATAQSNSEQATQRNNELKAVSNLVQNAHGSGRYLKDDGSFDQVKFANDISQAAPVYGGEVSNRAVSLANEIVSNKQALQNLNESQQRQLGGTFGQLATKPDLTHTDVIDALDAAAERNPGLRRLAISSMGSLPPNATPDQLRDFARRLAIGAEAPAAAQSNPAVSTTQGPNGLQAINTNPQNPSGVGPVGAPIQQGLSPSEKAESVDLGNGQRALLNRATGRYEIVQPGQGGQAASGPVANTGQRLPTIPRPSPNAPAVDQARYNKIMADSTQHAQDVSAAANDTQNGIGATRYRNDQILDLVAPGEHPMTGPGMESFNWLASRIPGESGDAYQKIGHYLAQNSAAIAKTMGVPNTNLGSETAAAGSGNTSQNPGAIREITKVNSALNTALDSYNKGLSKVSANGSDPTRVPAYRQAFGQNFDVNVFRYDEALRRNDKAEIDQLSQQLGPKGMQALGQKRKTLHALSETGDLPQ